MMAARRACVPYSPTMDAPRPPAPNSSSRSAEPGEPPHPGLRRRLVRWLQTNPTLHAVVIVALALGLIALALERTVEISLVKQRAAEERAAVLHSATEALATQTSSLLRLSALPLGWAVRSALLKDDLTSVDTYLQRIVQERHVTGAALVGADGKVRLAGNRKLEKLSAEAAFPGVAISGQSPTVTTGEHDLRAVVPVMGYDRRLGTVIVSYARPTAEDLAAAAAVPHP